MNKKFLSLALVLYIICFMLFSCADNTTKGSDSGSDTDATSASDKKSQDNENANIKFKDKIIFNLNTIDEDMSFEETISTSVPWIDYNEYNEPNLIYFCEEYSYYIYIELSRQAEAIIDTHKSIEIADFHSDKTKKLDDTHYIFVYKNFKSFKSVQKDLLHYIYESTMINKANIGILKKAYPAQFYDKVTVTDTLYNTSNYSMPKCDLIKSYKDFNNFLLKYNIELEENKINEKTFEENDILAIGSTSGGYNMGFYDFQIIDGKYFISSSFIEDGINTDDQLHHFIDFIIIPKNEKNIKAEGQKIFICNDKIIM